MGQANKIMSSLNELPKVQINETIEKDANGKVSKTSLMINIRSNQVEEAEELYRQLQAKLNGGGNAPTCECGSPMVLREGKKGPFYGCVAFPQCRKTKDLNGGKETEVSVEPKPIS